MSWKPKCTKNNERFKNLPPLKTFITVEEKKIKNKYEYSDELFPSLSKSNKKNKVVEESCENNNEEWTEVISKNTNEIKKKEEVIIEKEEEKIDWDEDDSLDEYFEIMNSGLIADINIYMSDFCKECGIHIYNSYDRGHNLMNLIKETSSEYDDIFIKNKEKLEEEEEQEEDNEEDEQNDNFII